MWYWIRWVLPIQRYLEPVIAKYRDKFKIIKYLKNPNTYLLQIVCVNSVVF